MFDELPPQNPTDLVEEIHRKAAEARDQGWPHDANAVFSDFLAGLPSEEAKRELERLLAALDK